MSWHGGLSLRSRFLLLLLLGAVLPLAVIGAWLVQSSGRAGEALLEAQLTEALDEVEEQVRGRWRTLQGDLLLLADNDVAWRMLTASSVSAAHRDYLREALLTGHTGIISAAWLDSSGTSRLSMRADTLRERPANPSALSATNAPTPLIAAPRPVRMPAGFPVSFAIRNDRGEQVGTLSAELTLASLLPSEPTAGAAETMAWVLDARTGAPLRGTPVASNTSGPARFERAGQTWIGLVRRLDSPPLELWMAAPLDPIVAPFARTARTSGFALVFVSLLVVLVTSYLTTRITRSVVEATKAAEAIAAGDLDHRIPVTRSDEVGRLGRALNSMAENLRGTLDALSRQRTLGALGEFATSLAHEVRNAHTTISVDLQRAIEQTEDRPEVRAILGRSLRRVRSVNRVVDGALSVARSGRVEPRLLDLREVLDDAVRASQPWFTERNARLEVAMPPEAVHVKGDPSALETLFVDLLRNAAQALDLRGQARLTLAPPNGVVEVVLEDNGHGMSAQDLVEVFKPFVTTREDGTGLGLPIARQIAYAHGGDLQITSEPGAGTMVVVRLG